jgi:DNA-binding NarL/FixJ family response regulator
MSAALQDRSIASTGQEHEDPRPRVLLADDNDPLLSRIARLLEAEFHVIGTTSNGRDLLEAADRMRPDLIVCDITMPLIDGFEAARRLRNSGATARIVFLTVHDDSDYLREGLSIGALGYVIKDNLLTDLSHALHEALAGRQFVSASPNLQL